MHCRITTWNKTKVLAPAHDDEPRAASLRDGDYASITAIYRHAVLHGTATFDVEPPSLEDVAARFASLRSQDYPCLVAEMDGAVVAYAYAGPHRPRPAYGATVEVSIYVDAQHRGHGIGTRLLAALIDETVARGFRQALAVIGDSRNAASIRLHAAHGFAHVGTFANVGWKFGRWLDTVLMQRTLGEGSSTPRSGA